MRGGCCVFALKHIVVNLQDESKSRQRDADASGMATGLLLAQMGVHEGHQGNGAGKRLLEEVFRVATRVHEEASYSFVVTDAATERLVSFYEKRGFTRIGNERRLIMKASTARGIVERLK